MKAVIIISRLLSAVFRPVYYPTVGIILLFTMTYLSMLPWAVKLWVLVLVCLFTVAMPALGTYVYRRVCGLRRHELRHQERRLVPYTIHLCSYLMCMHLLTQLHLPRFVTGIIMVSLLIQVSCILINMQWKISMHSAGAGGIIGALVAYAMLFRFNPVWWLCVAILVAGSVMSSRMFLRQHTLSQVLCGTLVGILCGYFGIVMM